MNTVILGAGFTGLAAAITSGGTVYEATEFPGGLGHDYELEGYKFSRAGGHWLFGGDPSIIGFVQTLTPCKRYERRASVYFPDSGEFYSYPIQRDTDFQESIATGEPQPDPPDPIVTMRDGLLASFGYLACKRFFFPFNDLYTAGLTDRVAPQDAYKSPTKGSGYNVSFLYPKEGLGMLARKMAARCNIRFNKRANAIDIKEKRVWFSDDTSVQYDRLISTLPLNRMVEMAGLNAGTPDPATSVLVLNIGATKGEKCPDSHWVYAPSSKSGFHRLGFYSNVDPMFAPEGKVAIYVERSIAQGAVIATENLQGEPDRFYLQEVVSELRSWGWIGDVDCVDSTFVPVAYTYRWPGSTWREDSLELLKQHDIVSCGRFGSWRFQGIMESIKEGFEAGCQT